MGYIVRYAIDLGVKIFNEVTNSNVIPTLFNGTHHLTTEAVSEDRESATDNHATTLTN